MVKVCILNNLNFSFNSIEEFNNIKDNIKNNLIITDIKQNNKNKLLQDIIYLMVNFCDNKFNIINTYHISKNYYLFTFYNPNNNNKVENILSYIIDNSFQDNYDENNKFFHNNIGCIIKLKNDNLYDVDIYNILKIIKYSNLHAYYKITPNEIFKVYYTNNPIFNNDDFNLYITPNYKNFELRIHFKFNDDIQFINYNESLDINKELILKIINNFHIFKDKKTLEYPLNTNIIISLHNKNQNINITSLLFEEIYKYIINLKNINNNFNNNLIDNNNNDKIKENIN